MVDGYHALKAATPNPDVQRDCDKKVRESQRMIQYFENSLAELDTRSASPAPGPDTPQKTLPTVPGSTDGPSNTKSDNSRWSKDSTDQNQPTSPPASGTPRKPNFSNLGESYTPITLEHALTMRPQTSSRQRHPSMPPKSQRWSTSSTSSSPSKSSSAMVSSAWLSSIR